MFSFFTNSIANIHICTSIQNDNSFQLWSNKHQVKTTFLNFYTVIYVYAVFSLEIYIQMVQAIGYLVSFPDTLGPEKGRESGDSA